MEKFFNNPGKKIKTLSKVSFILSIVSAAISYLALVVTASSGDGAAVLLSLFISGPIIASVILLGGYGSSLLLYGFGEHIENGEITKKQTYDINCRLYREFLKNSSGVSAKTIKTENTTNP